MRGRTAVATVVGLLVVALFVPTASAATRPDVVAAAVHYASERGFDVAVGVYDQQTDRYYGGGDDYGLFASESVVKVFIAARLLASGQMHGETEALAWKMITRSDNAAASTLYPRVGGDGLVDWVKARYDVPNLGHRPLVAGHWGATRITAGGMAHFYAHLRRDPAVRTWLLDAMHHAAHHASNGDNQFFGLAAATTGFAIKQGWGFDEGGHSELNSTGFVNDDRYAVALFVRGAHDTWGWPIYTAINGSARALLPAGQFPNVVPEITGMSRHSGTAGARITLYGSGFAGATSVVFGTIAADFHVVDDRHVRVVSPPHAAGTVYVHVVTPVRASGYSMKARFTYQP